MKLKMKLIKYNFLIYFLLVFCFINYNNIVVADSINIKQEVIKNDDINDDVTDDFDDSFYDDIDGEINTISINDPLEKINRKLFTLNVFLLDNFVAPIINGYTFIIPKFIRDCLSNFGDRFFDPMVLINSILQLDYINSFKTLATFTTNMTIGIFGLFNPAEHFGFYREKRTFGQTLYFYGIGSGIFLMVPFVGPTTLRDGVGILVNYAVDPFSFNLLQFDGRSGDLTPNELLIPKYVGGYSDKFESSVKLNKDFLKKSFDPYIFMRDSYLQNLEYKNKNIKRLGDKK